MTPEEQQLLNKGLEAARDYADALVKPPLNELGGLFSDVVGQWRLRNRVRMLLKTKRYCEERGVDPTSLEPSIFVPLIEAAGDTDDEDLSDMFAKLLCSHVSEGDAHPSFSKVLAQLSPADARLFKTYFVDCSWAEDVRSKELDRKLSMPLGQGLDNVPAEATQAHWICEYGVPIDKKAKSASVNLLLANDSMANLQRLGLMVCSRSETEEGDTILDYYWWYKTTDYGMRFGSACIS